MYLHKIKEEDLSLEGSSSSKKTVVGIVGGDNS